MPMKMSKHRIECLLTGLLKVQANKVKEYKQHLEEAKAENERLEELNQEQKVFQYQHTSTTSVPSK